MILSLLMIVFCVSVRYSGKKSYSMKKILSGIRENHLFLIIIITGVLLHFWELGKQSLWIDEMFTLRNIECTWSEVIKTSVTVNNSPPLYYICNKLFCYLGGYGEVALRFLSALFATLSVVMLYFFTKEIFSKKIALLSAFLLAINPLFLWFSHEARNYTMVVFLLLFSLLFALKYWKTGKKSHLLLFSLGALACSITSVQGMTIFPLCILFYFYSNREKKIDYVFWGVYFLLLIIALTVFVVLFSVKGPLPPARNFTGLEIFYTFYCYIFGYSFGPSISELQLSAKNALFANKGAIVLAILSLGTFAIFSVRKLDWKKLLPSIFFIVVFIGYAICIEVFTEHSYNVRYAFPGIIGVIIGIAVLLNDGFERITLKISKNGLVLSISLLLVLSLVACYNFLYDTKYSKEMVREAAQQIKEKGVDVLYVAPPYMFWSYSHYLEQTDIEIVRLTYKSDFEKIDFSDNNFAIALSRVHHIPFYKSMMEKLKEEEGSESIEKHSDLPNVVIYYSR